MSNANNAATHELSFGTTTPLPYYQSASKMPPPTQGIALNVVILVVGAVAIAGIAIGMAIQKKRERDAKIDGMLKMIERQGIDLSSTPATPPDMSLPKAPQTPTLVVDAKPVVKAQAVPDPANSVPQAPVKSEPASTLPTAKIAQVQASVMAAAVIATEGLDAVNPQHCDTEPSNSPEMNDDAIALLQQGAGCPT